MQYLLRPATFGVEQRLENDTVSLVAALGGCAVEIAAPIEESGRHMEIFRRTRL